MVAAFERRRRIAEVSPTRLAAVETVYAMTVHKSQGSQFDTVASCSGAGLADAHPRAAVHRRHAGPSERLIVVGNRGGRPGRHRRPIARASGLRQALWGEPA